MDRDREQEAGLDRLLRAALSQEPAATPGGCPGADELAAYAERSLPAGERAVLEHHLAECARCQDALALFATLEGQAAPSAASPAWPSWLGGWKRWFVPLGAVATGVLLYVAVKPDAVLRPALERQEAATASATPEPARKDAEPAAGPPPAPAAGQAAEPERRRAPLGPAPRKEPGGAAGGQGVAAGAGKGKATAAPVAPPAETAAPPRPAGAPAAVPRFVGAVAPAAPPPPPPPLPAQASKAEAKEQAAAIPDIAAPRALAETLKPSDAAGARGGRLVENVTVTGEAPIVQSRMAAATVSVKAILLEPPGTTVRWRVEPAGRISRSIDSGASWETQLVKTGAVLLAGSAPAVEICWVVGERGLVLRTTDGRTWETRPFPEPADLSAVSASGASHATVTARDGRRFATEDGGATWTVVR